MSSINELRAGINKVLNDNLPNIPIYNEKIEQGFAKPCFFIEVLNSEQYKELNRRYKKSISFNIQYFSDKAEINSDFNDIADKLYQVLEYVNIYNKLFRANKMTHKVVEGVLHFMLQFNYHVIKTSEEEPKMNKLTQEVDLKNG
ncbi:hypothetical protein JOC70_000342 [Clostridium pascui]|uniref:phage tail terminator family protein n=1 Tax=Clostridium pascui TaxID=46609 RepID=UPI00195E4030|nr:hypothetical protein [Clostridium pascui]MBM7868873.1 hypothetical protein [Clostridium pascui]